MYLSKVAFACLLFAALLSGCSKSTSPEDFASDMADHFKQVADRLEAVNSTTDADAAAGDIQGLIADMDALQQRARSLDSEGKVSDSVQAELTRQNDRVRQQVDRLQNGGLMTASLSSALSQLQASLGVAQAYAKAGALPEPETPLEQAYVDLIKLEERLGNAMAGISDRASAERALPTIEKELQNRADIELRLAQLGADLPPQGVPPKYATHYKAARERVVQIEQGLVSNPALKDVHEMMAAALADKQPQSAVEAERLLRLSGDLRRQGADKLVWIELRNRDQLQGPRHQQMIQMIKQAAGASYAEILIEDDGAYRLVVAPVSDVQSLASKLDLGAVSDVDPSRRSFTLTIDPSKVPEDNLAQNGAGGGLPPGFPPGRGPAGQPGGQPGGRPGFPPGAGPGGRPGFPPGGPGNPSASGGGGDAVNHPRVSAARDQQRNQHGADGLLEIHLMNDQFRETGPRMPKLFAALSQKLGGRMVQPVPVDPRTMVLFFASNKPAQEAADALDIGPVESVDAGARRIVIRLDPAKIPE